MSTVLLERIQDTPRLRIIRWLWSRDWNERTPWSLDGEDMPYIGRRVKDYGDGKVLTFWVFGPIARAHAEIVDT